MMPVTDGWEFRRRQLSHPRAADIPVIVVSGPRAAGRGTVGVRSSSVETGRLRPPDSHAHVGLSNVGGSVTRAAARRLFPFLEIVMLFRAAAEPDSMPVARG